MSSESDGKARIILPVSHVVEKAKRAKEEQLRVQRENQAHDTKKERDLIFAQARVIAAKMDQPVYVVECFKKDNAHFCLERLPNFAILLDHNGLFRCEMIMPDGTLGETWEYT